MRKIKILFLSIIFIAIVAIIQCNEVKAENLEEQNKDQDTYIVPYGKEIDLPSNGKYESSNTEIAKIGPDNKIRVCGVGYFTITGGENNETLKFFSWNAFLKKGKYYTYKDEKKKSKSDILYSKAYLAVAETNNKDAFKIVDHLLAGGTYKRETELNGKYISSDYNSKTGKSDTKYFEYSFEKKFSKIMPTEVKFEEENIELKLGDECKLNVKIEPEEVEDKTVIFESNDTSIVEVNKETGEILGVGIGEAIITAKTNNEKTAECKVNVIKGNDQVINVEEIKLEEESINLITEEEKTLKATVSPKWADNKEVTWESSNPEIVTVESDGKIKALKKGEAIITAKVQKNKNTDEYVTKTCKVTVKDEKLEIHFIDSGSWLDAIFIRAGEHSIFIDGGPGSRKIIQKETEYLDKLGVTHIDYYIASHSDQDHVEAGPTIINKYGIMNIIGGENGKSWKVIESDAKKQGIDISGRNVKTMVKGDYIEVGNIKITCIGPYQLYSKANYSSLMLRFDYKDTSFLSCGDNTKTDNFKKVKEEDPSLLDVDIFKNSHHNQDNSKIYELIGKPEYVVFTVGDGKKIKDKSIKKLVSLGVDKEKIFGVSNKEDGNVLIVSDGKNIKVQTGTDVLMPPEDLEHEQQEQPQQEEPQKEEPQQEQQGEAKIGNTIYATLQEAIDAVPENNEETRIELLKNIESNNKIIIHNNKNIVINFNNYDILTKMQNDGKLVLNTGKMIWKGKYEEYNDSYIGFPTIEYERKTFILNNGTLIVNNTEITANYLLDTICNKGELIINGGNITSSEFNRTYLASNIYNDGGVITINGGTIKSRGTVAGIKNINDGQIFLKDGTIETYNYWDIINGNPGIYTDGKGERKLLKSNAKVTITGGKIIAKNFNNIENKGILTITGGTMKSGNSHLYNICNYKSEDKAKIERTGGKLIGAGINSG